MAEYMGLKEDGVYEPAEKEDLFIRYYEKNWADILSDTYYTSEQLDVGHKFRSRLVYWGFTSQGTQLFTEKDFDAVSRIAVCIELVHKSSLLLDDFIDKDTVRHGLPSFHTIHGIERTVIYSLNLLSRSLRIINEVFVDYIQDGNFSGRTMQIVAATLEDMTLGVLKELDLDDNLFQDIEKIKEIMQLETASIITNSMVIGYYLTGNVNDKAEEFFRSIGQGMGFIFQAYNDMEPFCSVTTNEHKGSLNTDITRSRKNICVTLIYTLASKKEKQRLSETPLEELDALLLDLFNKYKIKTLLLREINLALGKIDKNIVGMKSYEIDSQWIEHFRAFAKTVAQVCENRLK